MNDQVMIVDDEPSILKTVEIILGSSGYKVHAVDSGDQCLDELRKGFKGVILMDIMMPRMDGYDTVAAIVSEGLHEGNIISMLTAVHEPGEKLEKLTEYVIDYVTKPFTSDQLFVAVSSLAGIRGLAA